jgi:hypothetical protein
LGGTYTPSTLEEKSEETGLQYLGAYGGVKLFTEHLETSVGFFYTLGTGESEIENTALTSSQRYQFIDLPVERLKMLLK